MINSQEIKIGTCIRLDNQIFTCIDFQHVKPGKGNTVMRTKLKNVCSIVRSKLALSWKMFASSVVPINFYIRMARNISS